MRTNYADWGKKISILNEYLCYFKVMLLDICMNTMTVKWENIKKGQLLRNISADVVFWIPNTLEVSYKERWLNGLFPSIKADEVNLTQFVCTRRRRVKHLLLNLQRRFWVCPAWTSACWDNVQGGLAILLKKIAAKKFKMPQNHIAGSVCARLLASNHQM